MEGRQELLIRAYTVFFLFVVLAVVIMFRVVKVSLVQGDKWRSKINVKEQMLKPERGNIYSEDYNLLSASLQFIDIHMDLSVVNTSLFEENLDSLAICLSSESWSTKGYRKWKSDLAKAYRTKKQYYKIARGLDIDEYRKLQKFPIFRLGRYEGGLIVSRKGKRVKPYGALASRTIGYSRDNAQDVGLERSFDKFLAGESKPVLMKKVIAKSNVWIPVNDLEDMELRRGSDVKTTLNVNMQDIVHTELKKQLVEMEAEGGVAVLMEVETGAIKAISNLVRSEPGVYSESYNRAVGHRSEPGSTVKLATVLALFDDGFCSEETLVDLNKGRMRFYDRIMRDSEYHGKTKVSLREAFEISSNVGISRLANEFYNNKKGAHRFIGKLKKYGVLSKCGIEIDGEELPDYKTPDHKRWSAITIPWMAHGYALSSTPLQILTFYNAVANDGKMMKPYLVSDILNDVETVKHFAPKVIDKRIAKASAIEKVQDLLEGVVTRGTGKALRSDVVSIAGKTGTTRVNYTRKQEKKKYNATFAGYFPSEAPKYSMIVMLYDPRTKHYGGSAAGPAFKRIAERVTTLVENLSSVPRSEMAVSADLPVGSVGHGGDFREIYDYVGLKYSMANKSKWVKTKPYDGSIKLEKSGIKKSTIPDVRGMGARDAVYVLENMGLKVSLEGVGKVKEQSIMPGKKINGQQIQLRLR